MPVEILNLYKKIYIYIYFNKSLYISYEKMWERIIRFRFFVRFFSLRSSVRGKRSEEREIFRKYWLISYAL